MKKFNLLVSCPRFHERDAIAEIKYLLSNIGDDETKASQTIFPGLVTARSNLDPLEVIEKLKILVEEDPHFLRYVLKIIPIETVIDSALEDLIEVAKALGTQIAKEESFRITIRSRFSPLNSEEVILKVAEQIDRQVNLTKPDKIVMIQILGEKTGISLLDPQDILSKAQFVQ